jgi:hypothetical protein
MGVPSGTPGCSQTEDKSITEPSFVLSMKLQAPRVPTFALAEVPFVVTAFSVTAARLITALRPHAACALGTIVLLESSILSVCVRGCCCVTDRQQAVASFKRRLSVIPQRQMWNN